MAKQVRGLLIRCTRCKSLRRPSRLGGVGFCIDCRIFYISRTAQRMMAPFRTIRHKRRRGYTPKRVES